MKIEWSSENSFSSEKPGFLLSGFLVLFIALSTLMGFSHIKSGDRFEFNEVSYLDLIKPSGISESDINAWDFDNGELEIFRLILRNTNSFKPAQAYSLAKVIYDECYQRGMDPSIVLGVIMVESRFRPDAISNKGAMGLMQLMPDTGLYVAEREGIEILTSKELYDPEINVRLGIAYLSDLETQYNDINHALGAYNYGPYNFDKKFGNPKLADFLPQYVSKVLKFKSRFDFELSNQRES